MVYLFVLQTAELKRSRGTAFELKDDKKSPFRIFFNITYKHSDFFWAPFSILCFVMELLYFWLFSAGLLQNFCKNTESLYKYRIFVEPEIVFPLLRHKWYLSQNHSYGWETFPHLHHHTYKDRLNTFTNNWNIMREVLNILDFFRT